jgi:hypothetical protein
MCLQIIRPNQTIRHEPAKPVFCFALNFNRVKKMSYILDALKKSEEARGQGMTRGLFDVPVRSSLPQKRSRRWPDLIAFILFLNVSLFVFWLHPWRGGGNMDTSGGRFTVRSFPETRPRATGATQPAHLTQAVEKQGNAQSQPEVALNLPASEGPKAAPLIPGGEREGEPNTSENAGQSANPVESSEIADVSPTVNGTQSIRETARDQVVETEVPPKDSSTMQGPKTEPVPTHPAPVKLPSATLGASKTTSAAVRKPVSPKLPQSRADAGTKQGLETVKPETDVKNPSETVVKNPAAVKNLAETAVKNPAAVKNPSARFEQSLQPGAGSGIVADLQCLSKPAARPEPKWRELAPQVRDAIPNISISMLVYSRKPEERRININGVKRKEGQEVSSGLKVEEITPDGAIFSYMGQRFYKGVVGD